MEISASVGLSTMDPRAQVNFVSVNALDLILDLELIKEGPRILIELDLSWSLGEMIFMYSWIFV